MARPLTIGHIEEKTMATAPNLYQLHGGGIHVSYSTTSIVGTPSFHYQDAHISHQFAGNQINVVQTNIGSLVTVVLRLTPDLGSTTFSVLIPIVNLSNESDSVNVRTYGITTVHRFSLIPALLHGQIENYKVSPLHGTARFVHF